MGKRGRSKTFQHGNLSATVWQDNKPVPVIATNGDPTVGTKVHKKNKDGSRAVVPCAGSVELIYGGSRPQRSASGVLQCSPKSVLQIHFLVPVRRFCDHQ